MDPLSKKAGSQPDIGNAGEKSQWKIEGNMIWIHCLEALERQRSWQDRLYSQCFSFKLRCGLDFST